MSYSKEVNRLSKFERAEFQPMDEITKKTINESPLFRHLVNKRGHEVVVTFKDNSKLNGMFVSYDFRKMFIELKDRKNKRVHFVNLHKVSAVTTPDTENL